MAGGRPKKQINKEQFEKLCIMLCTYEEICGFFDVSNKTLDRWCQETYGESFSSIYSKKREVGKISLRRSQFQLAQKNASMAIFLGKNYLGQTDVYGARFDENKEDDNFMNALKEASEKIWGDKNE